MAPRASLAARNQVDVSAKVACPGPVKSGLARWSRAFLQELELHDCELSIVVVDDDEIHRLNRQWRSIDRPTDVLSFPVDEVPTQFGVRRMLGDIVISLETARRRARAEGREVREELALYLAHGLLHLLGHDHHRASEARRMGAEERRLLGRAGMLELSGEARLTGRAARSEPRPTSVARRRVRQHR